MNVFSRHKRYRVPNASTNKISCEVGVIISNYFFECKTLIEHFQNASHGNSFVDDSQFPEMKSLD
jgi:hypothetical protein